MPWPLRWVWLRMMTTLKRRWSQRPDCHPYSGRPAVQRRPRPPAGVSRWPPVPRVGPLSVSAQRPASAQPPASAQRPPACRAYASVPNRRVCEPKKNCAGLTQSCAWLKRRKPSGRRCQPLQMGCWSAPSSSSCRRSPCCLTRCCCWLARRWKLNWPALPNPPEQRVLN